MPKRLHNKSAMKEAAQAQTWSFGCFPISLYAMKKAVLRNYNMPMRTRIVKIGNSLGVRIPKVLLEQSRLTEKVEIEAFDRQIFIRAAREL